MELEALAIQNGTALGAGAAYPVTIEHLAAWAQTLPLKGYALAPASAVMRARAEAPVVAQSEHAGEDAHAEAVAPVFKTVQAGYGRPREEATEDGDDHGGGHH